MIENVMFKVEQLLWWMVEKLMHLAWTIKDNRLERYARKHNETLRR